MQIAIDPTDAVDLNINPSKEYLNFQFKVLGILKPSVVPPWKLGWIRSQQEVNATCMYNWKDAVNLAKVFNKHDLSSSAADDVLNALQSISGRNKRKLVFPNVSLTTRSNILKLSEALYKRTIVQFYLPVEFYGLDVNGNKIIGAYATIIDPLSLIAEQLLLLEDETLFNFYPNIRYDESNERIYSGPASGNVFNNCFTSVQKFFGVNAFPLCITVMADGVVMNKLHNKACKPCYIRVANLRDDVLNSHDTLKCTGYAPQMMFTDAELLDMIIPTIKFKDKRKKIVT